MAKKPTPQPRVPMVWPKTGAQANVLPEDVNTWEKQGWKRSEPEQPKETD